MQERRFVAAFLTALAIAVTAQVVRGEQTTAWAWLASDYVGRLGCLLILFIFAETREVAFAREPLKLEAVAAGAWLAAIFAVQFLLARPAYHALNAAFPGSILRHYPRPEGALYILDMTVGMALVSVQEEILFRRCARHLFRASLGDGWLMTVAAALVFAAYHWQHGLGSMAAAFLFGVAAMTAYRKIGALLPVIIVHGLFDMIVFAR